MNRNTQTASSQKTSDPESLSMHALSILLVGPHNGRCQALAKSMAGPQIGALREFAGYPSVDALPGLVEPECDVAMVDVDADLERALDLIENVTSFKAFSDRDGLLEQE